MIQANDWGGGSGGYGDGGVVGVGGFGHGFGGGYGGGGYLWKVGELVWGIA